MTKIEQLELPATLIRMQKAAEAAGWTCEIVWGAGDAGSSVSLRMARGWGRCFGVWSTPPDGTKLRWMHGSFGGVKCGARGLMAHLFDAHEERQPPG